MRAIGNLLARLHAIRSAGFPGRTTSTSHSLRSDRISGLLGSTRTALLKGLIDTYRPFPSLDVASHPDLHPRNIVMADDGACVID